ncbi:hypothetical protein [Pantoea sp. SM3]|uniref:hypothetical protein n=1 Tax=Pantoea sp. SM3 TaxID=1628192 RepID=UPI0005F7CAE0|nr:hypothetical protein [Pantoea sp. SM3]KJV32236.1 hypothetical protein VI01_07840 [Pantoea sp. SM3]
MRARTVINGIHWLLTIMLLAFVWFTYQPDPRANDSLQSVRQVSAELWLYTTQNNDGGATVPTVFRYYFHNTGGADVKALNAEFPFLTGGGTISSVAVDGDRIHVDYSGKVYGMENKSGPYSLSYSIN